MSDVPNRIPWPPIIYVLAVIAGIALTVLYTLPWLDHPFSDLLFPVGCLLALAGIAIDIAALQTLRKNKTTFMPNRASDRLVVNGPFSFSRNPIYLGNTLLVVSIGILSGSWWFILTAVIAAFATQQLAIKGEERHLASKFGKRYFDYQKKVRRWI